MIGRQFTLHALAGLLTCAAVMACAKKKDDPSPQPVVTPEKSWDAAPAVVVPPLPPLPLGLPTVPSDSPLVTAELVHRGAALFADSSVWGGRSCADCHVAEHSYGSPKPQDTTAAGKTNLRHTPSLINLAFHRSYYWDGRSPTIRALLPGHARGQLGIEVPDAAATDALVAFALTRYEGNSNWDRYEAGDRKAVSEAVVRGATVFNERAGCARCHAPPLFTDLRKHESRVPRGEGPIDPATRFRTPTLRAIAKTAPYFHAGTSSDLPSAVDVELARDSTTLTVDERADLIEFLRSL